MQSKQRATRQSAEQFDPNDKYRKDGFLGRLHGKTVILKLKTGEEFTGVLGTNLYNRYEVLLTKKDDGLIVINKGSIVWVKEVK